MGLNFKFIEKLKKRHRAFTKHPLTKNHSYQALFRYLSFNISQKFSAKPRVFNWIEGLRFYAMKGDAGIVGNIYFKLFDYEDSMFLINRLKIDELFIDVGANLGHYSLLASGICKAKIIAFEPIRDTFEKLEKNIQLNNLQHQVQLYNTGVADVKGVLQFTTSFDAMNRVALEHDAIISKVQVTTLNEVLEGLNPAMMKIDVEGYEYFVLKGASEVLKNASLKYVIIELNNSCEKFGHSDEEIHQLLLANDFLPVRYSVENDNLIPVLSYNKDKFNTIYCRKTQLYLD